MMGMNTKSTEVPHMMDPAPYKDMWD
jgi:hypothetical protein